MSISQVIAAHCEAHLPMVNMVLYQREGEQIASFVKDGFDPQTLVRQYSVTKSIASLLTGICVDQGHIQSVNDQVSFYTDAYQGSVCAEICLKHLLCMDDGCVDDAHCGVNEADDPIAFYAAAKRVAEPGAVYKYQSRPANMLGHVVRAATGKTFQEIAQGYLFKALGITDFKWECDSIGNSYGSAGLYLRAADMLKIGELCLDKGVYKGQRVVSEAWIEESCRSHNAGGPPENTSYGYYWWCREFKKEHFYYAAGMRGQRIVIRPDCNEIIVIASDPDHGSNPWSLIELLLK